MKKYNCPNCGVASISFLQKMGLGPLKSVTCNSCNFFITVPWAMSIFVTMCNMILPWIAGVISIGLFKPSMPMGFVLSFSFGFILCTLFFLWIYVRYVPLIFKE